MATLSRFPLHLLSLTSHYSQTTNTSFSFFYHHSCFHSNLRYCNRQYSILCLASAKKSRPSRKLMNDDELCNVLREFVTSIGLPDGHVPSTKELSQHGRKDLANIVRRRGHKLIKELLANSAETSDQFDSLRNLNDDQEETGQEEKLNDMNEGQAAFPLVDDDSAFETSLELEHESDLLFNDESSLSKEPPLSLQEKVENFMKYGHLDTVEDDMYGGLKLNDGGKISNHGLVQGEPVIHNEGDTRYLALVSNNNVGHNGTLLLSRLSDLSAIEDNARDIYSSAQGPTDFQNDTHNEAGKMDNAVEINRLKHMLHQKELELSRLKEEVEREKQALSILQTKAENEISKAQNLILEKDAELLAAEDSLSGLVEAKIQYSGEGQMVEVAGSFNGWHQRIKMDRQPSSAIVDPVGSRVDMNCPFSLMNYISRVHDDD
ncbi:protein PTST homolog 3, chloroplastic isoform X2 [Beta vulgaris subsp. vulgaris]|uniref:protein PTST homolog 3, chloroplastic isoform X2 n=1 Tax=Beta vulgaris subsp. vulgaris TaxID=3555 RepID=UPI0025472842|nr:protein PTST homolog 3, chloroplastic isoform X2 [Beta vulgaris subsp. vulgaris]